MRLCKTSVGTLNDHPMVRILYIFNIKADLISAETVRAMGQKLWIDTDAGVDDALAILMALACQDIEIVGISTVRGNTAAHQVSLNVLRLLKVAEHQEVRWLTEKRKKKNSKSDDAIHGLIGHIFQNSGIFKCGFYSPIS